MSEPRIAVIGAGVSGLTCGAVLKERGHPVTIVARETSPHTTSDVAAASWYPYHIRPRTVTSLDELCREYAVVVNCAGLGARELADDPGLIGGRGVVLTGSTSLPYGVVNEDDPDALMYIIPRSGDCVIGGSDSDG